MCEEKRVFSSGDTVVFVNEYMNKYNPSHYPVKGTKGTVITVSERQMIVKWSEGSTTLDDIWWCSIEDVELVSKERKGKNGECYRVKHEKRDLIDRNKLLEGGFEFYDGYYIDDELYVKWNDVLRCVNKMESEEEEDDL